MRDKGRFTDLPKRLRETTEAMACTVTGVDMGLWNAHSNAALDAALKIEALEREAERLQAVIDGRPSINAGLPETYIRWSQSIYEMEAANVRGH